MEKPVVNLTKWIDENKSQFKPPVGNKLMYNEQLIIMYVGGPNIRDDYHINQGEEFFYMAKGDMCLKIVEKGCFKDIVIKEGEIFLLPGRVPHSPQRKENTVGLVIERKRADHEMDVLRYYIEPGKNTDVLFEKCFHSVNLGAELPPIINEYFASEEYKTRQPTENSIVKNLPFQINSEVEVGKVTKLEDHLKDADMDVFSLFSGENQFDIKVHCHGHYKFDSAEADHWLWVVEGEAKVVINGEEKPMKKQDSLLILANTSYTLDCEEGTKIIQVVQPTPN